MHPKEVNALCAQNVESFLAFLYGSNPATMIGGVWRMGNITGSSGDSVAIWPETGTYKDFATGDEVGDLLQLASKVWDVPFNVTISRIKDWLGIAEERQSSPSGTSFDDMDAKMAELQGAPTTLPEKAPKGTAWRYIPKGKDGRRDPWNDGSVQVNRRPDVIYHYPDRSGDGIFVVGRWNAKGIEKKRFQIASYRDAGWEMKAPDLVMWPLYRLDELCVWPHDQPVILVEGEKAAEWGKSNLPEYFWTTWHGGVGSVRRTDFIDLRDRLVILWPDNDDAGRTAMNNVQDVVTDALMVQCDPSWEDKADVADMDVATVRGVIGALLATHEAQDKTQEIIATVESRSVKPEHARELNQIGSIGRFLDRFGPDIHFAQEGKYWMYWDGRRWAKDKGKTYIHARAKETVKNTLVDFGKMTTKSLSYYNSANSVAHMSGIIEGASREIGIPVPETAFDADPDFINCKNGMVDLRTGKLVPHKKDKLMSKLIPYDYEAGRTPTQFLAFLNEIMMGDQQMVTFLQDYFGYALTGLPPDRIFVIFYGEGRNGKSTITNILESICADYHVKARSQSIMSTSREDKPDRIGEDLIPLRGARLVTMQESDKGVRLNEGKIKEMTGRDRMKCRYLHSNEWLEFPNTGKIILSTNHKPRVSGTDPGIWDRIAMVEFGYRIPDDKVDPDLPDRIVEQEAGAILSWMVEGAIRFYQNGKKVFRPHKIIQATNEYRMDEDSIGQFVGACVRPNPGTKVKVASLYKAYCDFMEDQGIPPLGNRNFAEGVRVHMGTMGGVISKTADGTYYKGVCLVATEEQEVLAQARKELPRSWALPGEEEPEVPGYPSEGGLGIF